MASIIPTFKISIVGTTTQRKWRPFRIDCTLWSNEACGKRSFLFITTWTKEERIELLCNRKVIDLYVPSPEFFPTDDMQTPPPPPPSPTLKRPYWHDRCPQCWIERKIYFSIFILWVTAQILLTIYGDTPWFSSVSATKIIVQKWPNLQVRYVQWAETNEKSIIRFLKFLVFEMWLILYWNFKKIGRPSQPPPGALPPGPGCFWIESS